MSVDDELPPRAQLLFGQALENLGTALVVICVPATLVLMLVYPPPIVAGQIGVPGAVGVPVFLLGEVMQWRAAQRKAEIEGEVPDGWQREWGTIPMLRRHFGQYNVRLVEVIR